MSAPDAYAEGLRKLASGIAETLGQDTARALGVAQQLTAAAVAGNPVGIAAALVDLVHDAIGMALAAGAPAVVTAGEVRIADVRGGDA